mmetsp:Transcript_6063/g.8980  ORF Transcript_6063/g.8980 Transcript_6063/m.8980 type:complete len:120 (+) Transcript_6063:343-702(+)
MLLTPTKYYLFADFHFLSSKFSRSKLVLVQALPNPTPAPNAVMTFLAAVPFPPGDNTMLTNAPAANPAPTYMVPRSTTPFWIMLDTAFSDDWVPLISMGAFDLRYSSEISTYGSSNCMQ